MYKPIDYEIFHVHTKRCKHAGEEEDYQYVESAIKLGAERIVFTDHCPFPGNPFGHRMDIEQLPEYIESMKALKKEYAPGIEILFGLETEYLPSFQSYYKELRALNEFDLLVIGQHFYENQDGSFSFNNKDKNEEYVGLSAAMVQGAESGLFDVIAHPDRMFRRCKDWNQGMMNASYEVGFAALKYGMILEKNYSSMERKGQYWDSFWVRTCSCRAEILEGYDAHSVAEMEKYWNRKYNFFLQEGIE